MSAQDALLRRYRQAVIAGFETLDLRGIPVPEGLSIPLERVYIRVQSQKEQTARHAPAPDAVKGAGDLGRLLTRGGAGPGAGEGRKPPVSPAEALDRDRKVALLGKPGAGKTTHLRYLALKAARDEHGPLPVLLELRQYAPDSPQSLAEFALGEAVRQANVTTSQDERRTLIGLLADAAGRGEVLFLFDALDEVIEGRDELARQANALAGHTACRIVLTSRPVGYVRVPGLAHYDALPLGGGQRDKFLSDWFAALSAGKGRDQAWADGRAAWLSQQIEDRRPLAALLDNPLMLTFLAILAGEELTGELPRSRVALYEAYLDSLMISWGRRRAGVELHQPLKLGQLDENQTREALWGALVEIGWALHQAYFDTVQDEDQGTRPWLLARLAGWAKQAKVEVDAGLLLDFWQEAGLIDHYRRASGEPLLAFRHLSFEEYLVARKLAAAWEKMSRRVWQQLKPRLHLPEWHEPILLLGGLLDEKQATALALRVYAADSPYETHLQRDALLAAELIGAGTVVEEKVARGWVHTWRHQLPSDQAVKALDWIGEIAVEPLLVTLRDENGDVREAAAGALGKIGDARAVAPLIAALGGPKGNVRRASVEALGQIGAASVEPLLAAPGAADSEVRRAAAWVLGHGDARAVEPLAAMLGDEEMLVRCQAAESLGWIGDAQAVELLLAALGDAEQYVRGAAARALTQIGEASVEPLIAALEDHWREVRWRAAWALGEIGDARAVEPLLAALGDAHRGMRPAAAGALGRIGDTRVVEPLLAALGDAHEAVRWAAAEALGRIGDARAVEPLIAALKDRWWEVRWRAAGALRQIGDARAVEPLIAALRDAEEIVREAAAWALGEIGDARAVEPLLAALGDAEGLVRDEAARALGKIGDARVVEPLLAALGDAEGLVRDEAARALGKIGDARTVEPLIAALGDENGDVREAAAGALRQIGDARAVEPLLAALGDAEGLVRDEAARALGSMADSLTPDQLEQAARKLAQQGEDSPLLTRIAQFEAARLSSFDLERHEISIPGWAYAALLAVAGIVTVALSRLVGDAIREALSGWIGQTSGLGFVVVVVGIVLGLAVAAGIGWWLKRRVE